MPDRVHELEFDELEKLLGEIPSVTSVNSNTENQKSVSFDVSMVRSRPICVTPEKDTFNSKLLRPTGSLSDGKLPVNKVHQQNIRRVQIMEDSLSSDQSLASVFEDLSIKDRPIMVSPNPSLVSSSTNFNAHSLLFNGQHPSNLRKVDSPFIVVPSQPSANSPSSFDLNDQQLVKQQLGYCQTMENFNGALPLAHSVQGFHLLPNVVIPAVEIPIIHNQQQLFFDSQSPLPYLHTPQQQSESNITWRNLEEQHYVQMDQPYLYMQQLRNSQQLDSQQCPIQQNGNVVTRLMSQNTCQACNQEPFWNSGTTRRNTNQPNNSMHISNQKVPEKILTRSNGLNSLASVKFGSFGGNEPVSRVNQVGRVLPHESFTRSVATPKIDFHLDYFSTRGSAYLKHNNLKQPKYSNPVDDFGERIYSMAKDQHGCRLLQRKFTEGTREELETIFREIIVHVGELMTDPFGNYLVQKLLEVCDKDQHMQILHAITRKPGDLVRISCDMHGTRAVQKVIETLKTPEQCSMVISSLKAGVVGLIKNMNGNHVAQRFLQYLKPEFNEFLFEAATINCVELATDRHGCCVLQKCLSHSDGEQRRRLVCEITSNALILSQDPYGNYVVQYVFEIQVPWATTDILDQLEGNYGDLAMQKYSSNVVEKCIKYAGEEQRLRIIDELMNNPHLDQIMQDPYGNYVIQAALNLSKGAVHDALVEAIRPHVPVLRTSPYGKKVLSSNGLKK